MQAKCTRDKPSSQGRRRTLRAAVALAIAALAGGCFQPLYGERSITGSPALRESLAAVDIQPIEVPTGGTDTRMAVQIRNDLIFNFTGGGAPYPPTHRLKIRLVGGHAVDNIVETAEVQDHGLVARPLGPQLNRLGIGATIGSRRELGGDAPAVLLGQEADQLLAFQSLRVGAEQLADRPVHLLEAAKSIEQRDPDRRVGEAPLEALR